MEVIYTLLGLSFFIFIIAGIVGVIRPSIYARIFGKHATRLKCLGIFFLLSIIALTLASISEPESVKQARLAKEKSDAKAQQIATKEKQPANKIAYKVVKVIDGDTIDVSVDGKTSRVRLIGIDTPESKDPRKTVECFAVEASNKLTEIVLNKDVTLLADSSQGDKDKYKRLLRYIQLDGTIVNQTMISEGFAYEYTYKTPYQFQKQFKASQEKAKTSSLGLWSPNTCEGKRTKPAVAPAPAPAPAVAPAPAPAPAPAAAPAPSSTGVVKMSSSGICHAPGTTYYDRTTNFTPYQSTSSCLAAGGRLPLR